MRTLANIAIAAIFALTGFATSAQAGSGIRSSNLLPSVKAGETVTLSVTKTTKKAQTVAPAPAKTEEATATVAKAKQPKATGARLTCLHEASADEWKVVWKGGGTGKCPGDVLKSDMQAIANMAEVKKLGNVYAAFRIPAKCNKGKGWVVIPVSVYYGKKWVMPNAYTKQGCIGGHGDYRTLAQLNPGVF